MAAKGVFLAGEPPSPAVTPPAAAGRLPAGFVPPSDPRRRPTALPAAAHAPRLDQAQQAQQVQLAKQVPAAAAPAPAPADGGPGSAGSSESTEGSVYRLVGQTMAQRSPAPQQWPQQPAAGAAGGGTPQSQLVCSQQAPGSSGQRPDRGGSGGGAASLLPLGFGSERSRGTGSRLLPPGFPSGSHSLSGGKCSKRPSDRRGMAPSERAAGGVAPVAGSTAQQEAERAAIRALFESDTEDERSSPTVPAARPAPIKRGCESDGGGAKRPRTEKTAA